MGKTVSFNRPDGKSVSGYLAEPKAGGPGIVVIQEWWGMNDQIRGVADKLAAAGYRALVPDLYRGKSTVEAEEAHHLMTGLNFGDAASNDVRGAVQFLKGRAIGSGKVGVTGYCMGGALTVLALTMAPETDAGVIWYGLPPLEYVDATKIGARPVMAHWASQVHGGPARSTARQGRSHSAIVTARATTPALASSPKPVAIGGAGNVVIPLPPAGLSPVRGRRSASCDPRPAAPTPRRIG